MTVMERPRQFRKAVGSAMAVWLLLARCTAAAAAAPAPAAKPASEAAAPSSSSEPTASGEPPTQGSGHDGAAAAVPEPIDVVVAGDRPMPPAGSGAEHSFKRRDIERMPGAFGDALRAVEVLPGITPFVSGLPHFVVRGAMPSATGYFIDGIRVPLLYHLGVGPSVISASLVQSVDFFPGPYPAQYGRQVGCSLIGVVGRNGGYTARVATACGGESLVPDSPEAEKTSGFHQVAAYRRVRGDSLT